MCAYILVCFLAGGWLEVRGVCAASRCDLRPSRRPDSRVPPTPPSAGSSVGFSTGRQVAGLNSSLLAQRLPGGTTSIGPCGTSEAHHGRLTCREAAPLVPMCTDARFHPFIHPSVVDLQPLRLMPLLLVGWPGVPELEHQGFFVRRHLALDLVCGADFSCVLMCRAGPGDLGGTGGRFR